MQPIAPAQRHNLGKPKTGAVGEDGRRPQPPEVAPRRPLIAQYFEFYRINEGLVRDHDASKSSGNSATIAGESLKDRYRDNSATLRRHLDLGPSGESRGELWEDPLSGKLTPD